MNLSILSFWLFLIVCYLLYITPKVFFNKLMKRISILQKKKVYKLEIMCFCVWIEHFFMNRAKSHIVQPISMKVCWQAIEISFSMLKISFFIEIIFDDFTAAILANWKLPSGIFIRFSSNLRFEYFKRIASFGIRNALFYVIKLLLTKWRLKKTLKPEVTWISKQNPDSYRSWLTEHEFMQIKCFSPNWPLK